MSKGRGALLQKLLQLQTTSDDESGMKSLDSGVSTTLQSNPNLIPNIPIVRSTGRGRLLEIISNISDPDDSVSKDSKKQESSGSLKSLNFEKINLTPTKELHTPKPEIKVEKGHSGTQTPAVCNYIKLLSDPQKSVHEYEVKFSPDVDNKNFRFKYLNEHRDKYGGTKTFDGVTLWLPIKLPDHETVYTSKNITGDETVEIKVIYKKQKNLADCIQLYNVLFDRVMKTLNYVRFDRKQFDPREPKIIPQHRLEIWPGYVTAVNEYEGGLMLCCDVSHRLLCQKTVLQHLAEIYNADRDRFQENAKKSLLGSIVITRYNNRNYRIDDITFTQNPLSTFRAVDRDISFVNYYKTQYNITIKDVKQPLLISLAKKKKSNHEYEEVEYILVPEICHLTGLRDEMRSDGKVLRDIITYTRVTPNQRQLALQKFYNNVNQNKEAREILESWGLKLESHVQKLMGRELAPEKVFFAQNSITVDSKADFSQHTGKNEMLEVVHISDWLLIYCARDEKVTNIFIDQYQKSGEAMGVKVGQPKCQKLQDDRTNTFVAALRNNIKSTTQVVVIICPTARDDRYEAIKKVCCCEIPVPSQVINAKTLSNPQRNRSIVQKIALQINCKVGGSLWTVKIPFQNVMICGIDTYHDPGNKGKSVAAFVASLNSTYSNWYSRAMIQNPKEEIVNGLCASLLFALSAYKERNNVLPDKIIVFRDGVGDSQLKVCEEYEVPQLIAACEVGHPNYKPMLTYVVVQKRVNTRFFMEKLQGYQNPNPGFVVDHTVTKKSMCDFFLISQSVGTGTVSPTHYIVVYNNSNFGLDIIQRLAYKLCFLYYNWPGTVGVPACCQYAHKLAYLVGQHIKKPTSEVLEKQLFFL